MKYHILIVDYSTTSIPQKENSSTKNSTENQSPLKTISEKSLNKQGTWKLGLVDARLTLRRSAVQIDEE